MSIYDLDKEKIKKYDQEFSQTTYGKYILIATSFPLIISIFVLFSSAILVILSVKYDSDELLNIGLISISFSFIIYILSIICYILRLKELKKYIESKKKKK